MNAANYISSFLLSGILLFSIVGVPINSHYCGGSFVATTVGVPLDDACGDLPMDDDCCDDETVLYSVTDSFNSFSITFVKDITPSILVCNYTQCIKPIPLLVEPNFLAEHKPPPIESRIFVEIQSFLL